MTMVSFNAIASIGAGSDSGSCNATNITGEIGACPAGVPNCRLIEVHTWRDVRPIAAPKRRAHPGGVDNPAGQASKSRSEPRREPLNFPIHDKDVDETQRRMRKRSRQGSYDHEPT